MDLEVRAENNMELIDKIIELTQENKITWKYEHIMNSYESSDFNGVSFEILDENFKIIVYDYIAKYDKKINYITSINLDNLKRFHSVRSKIAIQNTLEKLKG